MRAEQPGQGRRQQPSRGAKQRDAAGTSAAAQAASARAANTGVAAEAADPAPRDAADAQIAAELTRTVQSVAHVRQPQGHVVRCSSNSMLAFTSRTSLVGACGMLLGPSQLHLQAVNVLRAPPIAVPLLLAGRTPVARPPPYPQPVRQVASHGFLPDAYRCLTAVWAHFRREWNRKHAGQSSIYSGPFKKGSSADALARVRDVLDYRQSEPLRCSLFSCTQSSLPGGVPLPIACQLPPVCLTVLPIAPAGGAKNDVLNRCAAAIEDALGLRRGQQLPIGRLQELLHCYIPVAGAQGWQAMWLETAVEACRFDGLGKPAGMSHSALHTHSVCADRWKLFNVPDTDPRVGLRCDTAPCT